MIGLYILTSNALVKLQTIKFGMSMRIEYRWIDYLQIFNDAKYIYYYEFLNNMVREQIIFIESEIIQLHIKNRNFDFQTEYFIIDDYNIFHQSIIRILDKYKINYRIHNKHEFVRSYYDSKPESLNPHLINQLDQLIQYNNLDNFNKLINLNRYSQLEAFNAFKKIIKLDIYWGLIIAPTGFGKSLLHIIFLCYYLEKNPLLNCMLITKKKDLLTDINSDIDTDLNILLNSGLIKFKPNIIYCVDNSYDPSIINKEYNKSIIIINIDKLINKQLSEKEPHDPLAKIKLIKWSKIGFLIFDEVHHIGSKSVFQLMSYLKNIIKLKYVIGSSATPTRAIQLNQNNLRILFNKSIQPIQIKELLKEDLNILHEITYKEAWEHNIILRIKIELIIIDQQLIIIDNPKDQIIGFSYTNDGKEIIKTKIINILDRSFKHKIIFYTANRLSCLEWFEYISNDIRFNIYNKHISFSMNENTVEDDNSLCAKIIKKKKELNINNLYIINGITNFKLDNSYSMLFVVSKATEGFNDKNLDIVFNLDPIIDRSIVLELQKMGRTTRIATNKEVGIYVSPIIKTDNYIDDMTNFMADFIKSISKPINDKNHINKSRSKIEYDNIYRQIFNINGLLDIESNIIYDLVYKKTNSYLTYSDCIQIIKDVEHKPTSKKEYYNLCLIDTRLNLELDILFGIKFDWIEYLSIDRNLYYDINECKIKINYFLKTNPIFNNKLPSTIIDELCKSDNKFPSNDIFIEYYKVPINELIKKINKPKIIRKIITL